MPQSLAKVLVHIVYSTKGRHEWLQDEEIRRQLYAYKATILRDNVDTPALIINGVEESRSMNDTSGISPAGTTAAQSRRDDPMPAQAIGLGGRTKQQTKAPKGRP